MANIADCIQRAVDAKDLHAGRGVALLSEYDQLVQRYASSGMPQPQAAASAAASLRETNRRAARSRRHAVLWQLQTMQKMRQQVLSADDAARMLTDLIEGHTRLGFTGESVRGLQEALIDSINAGLREVLAKHGLNLAGTPRERVKLRDLLRELHGEKTGNAEAARLVDAVRYQQKRMRQMFNAHGGDIGELADYGVPHSHSPEALIKAGFDAWANEITPRLAWDRIEDLTTAQPFAAAAGQAPANAAAARDFLQRVYDNITRPGGREVEPSLGGGNGTALYRRRADHRLLHFASADDWIDYNAKFGAADPFSAMINGLHGLARDVALMRVLGPNPHAMLDFTIDLARQRAQKAGDDRLMRRVDRRGKLARSMLNGVSGANSVPDNLVFAAIGAGTRATLSSIQLGSAVISSVTDGATVRMASRVMGMNPNNVYARTVKLMASSLTREEAASMGWVAQSLGEVGAGSSRFFADTLGNGLPQRLADVTLRASGLNFITDMRRIAFQWEAAALMGQMAGRGFDAIEPRLRRVLEKRGITAADWDKLRHPSGLIRGKDGSGPFLSPMVWLEHQDVLGRGEAEGLAMRLQMAIREELEFAVPTASLEGRALMVGDSKPGSAGGELLRSTAMYKSFPLSIMLSQWRRFHDLPEGMSPALYAASLSVQLMLLGGLAVQLKEIAKGNDPRPMTDATFWQAAVMQGGGLGIFGDFFSASASRAGGGLAETLAGPVVGLGGDVLRLFSGPADAAVSGEKFNAGRNLSRFLRQNTPVASTLWPVRAAYDRLVADTFQRFLDPDAEADWARREKQMQRDYGNRSFWHRGEALPDRLPDLSNAFGGR